MSDNFILQKPGQVLPDNRPHTSEKNRLGVTTDQEALALFLRRAARRSPETLRRYTRELVRFTFFLKKERLKHFNQVTVADIESYVSFIQSPWPHWQKPGMDARQPDKIFFPNPIKPGNSTDQIITVLSSFFNYLHATGYIQGNPVIGFDKTGEKHARGHTEPRYFYNDEWAAVMEGLQHYPQNNERQQLEKARLIYVLTISYGLGLRQSELADHTCADIRPDRNGDMTLHIRGKGRRLRQLPINDQLLAAIGHYRQLHGQTTFDYDLFPLAPCQRPAQFKNKAWHYRSMSSRQIRKWFSGFLDYCADRQEVDDHDLAKRIRSKSFHSLRHTSLSHLARKMDIEDLSVMAGHEAITTTQQYYTPERHHLRQLTREHTLVIKG